MNILSLRWCFILFFYEFITQSDPVTGNYTHEYSHLTVLEGCTIEECWSDKSSYHIKKSTKDLYIGGLTLEHFNYDKKEEFKLLVLSIADAFCHYYYYLSADTHLTAANISHNDFNNCPKDWPHSNYCIHSSLSVSFCYKNQSRSLSCDELNDLWNQIQSSSKFKELGLKSYDIPTSAKTFIIILSVIIGILLLSVIILLFFMRNKIRELMSGRIEEERVNEHVNYNIDNNHNINSFNNCSHQQQLVPPLFYTDERQNTHLNTHKTYNSKLGIQNNGFVQDKNDKLGKPKEATQEIVDDFDSDDEFNFPSPLKAPPLPPRPKNKERPLDHNDTTIHYMVSPIKC